MIYYDIPYTITCHNLHVVAEQPRRQMLQPRGVEGLDPEPAHQLPDPGMYLCLYMSMYL